MSRAWLCALLLATLGCQGGDEPAPASASSGASRAAAPSASVKGYQAGEQYDDADLKVAPDFEEEAEKVITEANYKQKLEQIEAELSGTAASAAPATSAAPSAKPAAPASPDEKR